MQFYGSKIKYFYIYVPSVRILKGEERKVYRDFVGKPEVKRPLGRPRSSWENGIRMDLRRICWGVQSGFSWPKIVTGGGLL
jgi:hypothetical protein